MGHDGFTLTSYISHNAFMNLLSCCSTCQLPPASRASKLKLSKSENAESLVAMETPSLTRDVQVEKFSNIINQHDYVLVLKTL